MEDYKMSEEQLISTPSVFGETGNFLLERELGKGGMGGVYMGRDKMLDRPVAVKVMLREYGSDIEFIERFKHEAQAAARLIHPNIAQVYSYGIADGMPYIAMELVAGGSLDQLMKLQPGKIDIPRVMKICEQVAQALRCSADQGLVHGDIKPENVLLDANGNAKIVDFGLAAMQKNTDEIWGTPYYIAPEKVKKEPVDYRADMYSLGGTLYHALTGVAPFEGDDAAAVVRKRFEGAPVPPSQVRPGISPQIDALILKMLALDPAERYPSSLVITAKLPLSPA
jgi:serine/threonine-protein kinase